MVNRKVDEPATEVPDIPELLEQVMIYALEEGKSTLQSGEDVVPFTCLVLRENVFIETHPGQSSGECFAGAQSVMSVARGGSAYAFCYDGYVETDEGHKDALIAEGGLPGADNGYAIGLLYEESAEHQFKFDQDVAYIGEAPNFMRPLKQADEYSDEEIDEHYLSATPTEFDELEVDPASVEGAE